MRFFFDHVGFDQISGHFFEDLFCFFFFCKNLGGGEQETMMNEDLAFFFVCFLRYFMISVLCWLSKPTCIVGMYLLCCSFLNYLAWRNEEQYDPPERQLRKFPVFSWCAKDSNVVQEFEDWYYEIRVNGDWKK